MWAEPIQESEAETEIVASEGKCDTPDVGSAASTTPVDKKFAPVHHDDAIVGKDIPTDSQKSVITDEQVSFRHYY